MVYSESDLVLPSLQALCEHDKPGLSTAELQPILRSRLRPKGEDLDTLEGRHDDKFSQKVRNIKSHNRLSRDKLAVFKNNRHFITNTGRNFVQDFLGVDERYRAQGFSEVKKKIAIRPHNVNVFVEEGGDSNISARVRKRSQILRNFALKHYSDENSNITCKGCGFEGTQFYGDVAQGLIEIHHLNPIALKRGGMRQTLLEAVGSVVPLCPNCHRLVHRRPKSLMSLRQLRVLTGYRG